MAPLQDPGADGLVTFGVALWSSLPIALPIRKLEVGHNERKPASLLFCPLGVMCQVWCIQTCFFFCSALDSFTVCCSLQHACHRQLTTLSSMLTVFVVAMIHETEGMHCSGAPCTVPLVTGQYHCLSLLAGYSEIQYTSPSIVSVTFPTNAAKRNPYVPSFVKVVFLDKEGTYHQAAQQQEEQAALQQPGAQQQLTLHPQKWVTAFVEWRPRRPGRLKAQAVIAYTGDSSAISWSLEHVSPGMYACKTCLSKLMFTML